MTKLTLSFDDGPDADSTNHVLDVLANWDIKSSFFVIGAKVMDPEARKASERAVAEGHWLGSHSFSHHVPLGWMTSDAETILEIDRGTRAMGDLATPDLMYRPFGAGGVTDTRLLNRTAVDHLKRTGYSCVLWNFTPREWRNPDTWVDLVVAECKRETDGGDHAAGKNDRSVAGVMADPVSGNPSGTHAGGISGIAPSGMAERRGQKAPIHRQFCESRSDGGVQFYADFPTFFRKSLEANLDVNAILLAKVRVLCADIEFSRASGPFLLGRGGRLNGLLLRIGLLHPDSRGAFDSVRRQAMSGWRPEFKPRLEENSSALGDPFTNQLLCIDGLEGHP